MIQSRVQEKLLVKKVPVEALDKKTARMFKVMSNVEQTYSVRCVEYVNSTPSPQGNRGC